MRGHPSAHPCAPALVAALLTSLALPAASVAQQTPGEQAAAARKRASVEREARRKVETLFGRLCPGRCELIDLEAVIEEPEPVGEVAPGFDAVTSNAYKAEVERVEVSVLLDSKMPEAFLKNMPRMIRYRLQGVAPTVSVRPELLEFPEPQLAPTPPLPEQPEPKAEPPEPKPEEKPEAEPKPEEEPEPEKKPEEEKPEDKKPEDERPWWLEMLAGLWNELLPWIPFILTILVMAGMLLYLMRRLREIEESARASAGADGGGGGEGEGGRGAPDLDALRKELRASRAVQNRVLRRWLLDDPEAVALLVRMLGPEILDDLKNDPKLRPAIETVSEEVARADDPIEDSEQQRIAREARARITSARVLHEEGDLAGDWEFLEGASLAHLRRVMGDLSAAETSYVIGQLPPALRAAYLESLDTRRRRELLVNTSGGEVMSRDQAIELAARVRGELDELSHIGGEARGQAQLVTEMLAALPLDEQRDTLRELDRRRPEVAEAVLSQFLLESAPLHAPEEVLADAMFRTPIETLTHFLRGTTDEVRSYLTAVAPGNIKPALEAELDLDIPVSRTDFLEAREEFTRTLAVVLKRDGFDLAPINRSALRGVEPGAGTTQEVSA